MNIDICKMSLKEKQYWLLMLRHGSKCNNENCITDKCKDMRDLWKHIISCKNIECTNKCNFSRVLLSHYAKCKEECKFCVPIRDAIGRHNKRIHDIRNNHQNKESSDNLKFSVEEENMHIQGALILASLRISPQKL